MAHAKKTKTPKSPEWITFPFDRYAKVCAELVTFSNKTVNSNAHIGGIRLSGKQKLELPHVSARTMLAAGEVPALDYMGDAARARVVSQLNQLLRGTSAAPSDEASQILTLLAETTTEGAQFGTDRVSIRVRQLLLPHRDGYVAVTPLSAGGVSQRILTGVREHNERVKIEQTKKEEKQVAKLRRIPLAVFGLGGSHSQNIGSLVRDMQRPLVSFAPTENRQLKAILALHFHGIRIWLPRDLMNDFRAWCADCRRRNGGLILTNMITRDEEIDRVRRIAEIVLAQGEAARQRLLAQRDLLPAGGKPLVSAHVDPVVQGLMDPELRGRDWPRAFATRLANLIGDYRFGDHEEGFRFEQADIHELQAMIEEVAR